MQQCRSGVALPADGERRRPLSLSCLLSVTAAVALAVIAFLALPPAAQAGAPPVTFCQVTGLSACAGPITSSSQNISGAGQQRIEEHLQQLRCKDSNDPNCNAVGAAAADSVSYAGLSFFVSGDYEHKDRTATGAELGFDSNAFGPTIGVDYRLAPNAVIGGAFDYDHAMGDFDANYGDFDTDTFTWIFFGSYSPSDQSFIDASVGFGAKQYDTRHDDPGTGANNTVKGDTSGFEFSADLTGGYDFSFGAFTVGPRAGLHYKRSELNGFTETGTGALFTYSDQVDDSLTGTIGFQASYAISTDFGVVVPQVNGEYVREFLTDHNTYTAASAAGAPFNFVTDDPDLNHFNVGAGVVFVLPDGISPFLNFQAELANRLEETQTVTAGVRVEM
jgi:outer membrane lipase/esterase